MDQRIPVLPINGAIAGGILLLTLSSMAIGIEAPSKITDVKELRELIDHLQSDAKASVTIEQVDAEIQKRHHVTTAYAFASGSRQKGDKKFPRTIRHAYKTNLFYAYTTHHKFGGFDRKEVVHYNEKTDDWDFYELTFPTSENGLKEVQFSDPNPTKCFNCHLGRPRWDAYPIWKGTYGGDHGDIKGPELKNFRALVEHSEKNPRLKEHKDLIYLRSNLDSLEEKDEEGNPHYSFLGSGNIGSDLTELNFRRIGAGLKKSGGFDQYRYAYLAALLKCEEFAAYLPTDDARLRFLKRYPPLFEASKKEYEEYLSRGYRPYDEQNYLDQYYLPDRITELKFLTEEMGVSYQGWSLVDKGRMMVLTAGQFAFSYVNRNADHKKPSPSDRIPDPRNDAWPYLFMQGLSKADPSLLAYDVVANPALSQKEACKNLKKAVTGAQATQRLPAPAGSLHVRPTSPR